MTAKDAALNVALLAAEMVVSHAARADRERKAWNEAIQGLAADKEVRESRERRRRPKREPTLHEMLASLE